ncbi:hypothetical protein [Streptomyces akebiae]|uniref:Uncharacterized protein n=1 Tax=Streptomyces akebiae TaxID=2865673 RepID=A0ABX8Y2X6_9ACTN|nr:hypothetical protein [Streptomyces akebiae]QYX82259.1 hypothetical protein K1J60_42035 [Streptomyces akebiae]
MPGSMIFAAGPEGAMGFLYLAWKGILGILGFCIALNIRDAAYRIYEFFTSRGPFAPGPGFSPLVIRIVGALIGAVSTWSFVSGLTS